MAIKLGINGFGRIGRNFLRALIKQGGSDVQLVAVNDLTDPEILAHLLRYDSTHGVLDADIAVQGRTLTVGGNTIEVLSEMDPAALPWKDMGVQVVIESTGRFTDRDGAGKHLDAGADRVVISAPSTDPDFTIVMGVNDHE